MSTPLDLDERATLPAPRFPASKFSPESRGPIVVRRERLFDILDDAASRRLTLVVGAPGAGKTVLLNDWIAARPQLTTAWMTCDTWDADPSRFMLAIIEAIRRSSGDPTLCEDAFGLLVRSGGDPARGEDFAPDVVGALSDDIGRMPVGITLVVDDLHLCGPAAAKTLPVLIEHVAPRVRLILASRHDPPLSLLHLRANEDLAVVRDAALALSLAETGSLLSHFGFELQASDLKVVHARSEGWVAGVQMAALSMQSSPEPLEVIRRMELRTGTVMRYFVEEVLERQPPEIADFMLATSVLEELSPESCTVLCGPEAGRLLQRVHRGNLFLVQVGGADPIYRYHHLVRDILRAQLRAQEPDRARRLHAESAAFLAARGRVYAAARQLFEAGDADGALSMLSTMVGRAYLTDPDLRVDESVSPSAFAGSPRLLEPLAAWLLLSGDFGAGASALMLAEQGPIDATEDPQLASDLAGTQSLRHLLVGEFEEALRYLDRARALLPQRTGLDDSMAGFLVLELGGLVGLGRLPEARRVVTEATRLGAPEAVIDILCRGYMSRIALLEGRIAEAERLAGKSLETAGRLGFDRHYSSVEAKLVIAEATYERGALAESEALIEEILRVVSGARPMYEYLAQLARARIWGARGEFEPALASLGPARTTLRSDRSPLLSAADALEAVFRMRLGDRHGAFDRADRLPEPERGIMIARLALASNDQELAARVGDELPWAGLTVRQDLQQRLIRASLAVLDGTPRADRSVTESLAFAAAHGYLVTVLETAPGLADHVIAQPRRYGPSDWVSALATASLTTDWREHEGDGSDRLVEPLTEAELRVLRCLPLNMTSAAMAAYLNISPNTIKTHLSHIYMKLDANSRGAALERAMALGIL